MRREYGAALAETVILMLVLTPIMFGVPLIGKLIDLRQTTVQASRYAAWEATVDPLQTAPKDVKARFFSDSSKSLGGDASAPNSLWGGNRNGDTAAQLPEVTHQTLKNSWQAAHAQVQLDETTGAALPYTSAYGAGANGDVTLRMQDMIEEAGGAAANITEGTWMDSGHLKGMLRSDIRANVKGNGWFETLSFNDATVLMYDNWASGSDDMAALRSRAMVPAGALEEPGNIFSSFGNFPLFKELLDFDNVFGRVDMRPLPDSEKRQRTIQPYTEN